MENNVTIDTAIEQPIDSSNDTASGTTPTETPSAEIEGISNATILRYFETLNASDFQATANLFASDGALNPPFETPVVGREAIVTYLEAEAKGMQLYPRQAIAESTEIGETIVKVSGTVQTSLFRVNVSWHFVLTPQSEILSVKIKLLAAMDELLKLRKDS
jgi:hypothetical protein